MKPIWAKCVVIRKETPFTKFNPQQQAVLYGAAFFVK